MQHTDAQALRVLVVDDEEPVLEAFEGALTICGNAPEDESELEELAARLFGGGEVRSELPALDVTLCRQGDEAIEAVRAAREEERPYAVAFVDVRMPPGPDGVWTAERIRALDPHIEIVIVTGYSDVEPEEIARRVPPAEALYYVQKPLHPAELRQFAVALGAQWRLAGKIRAELRQTNARLRHHVASCAEAEQSLRICEDQQRALAENAPVGIWHTAVDGSTIYANPAMCDMLELDGPEELSGQSFRRFFTPASLAMIERQEVTRAQERVPCIYEVEMVGKRGTRRDVLMSAAPVRGPDGELQGYIGTFADITESKRAAEALAASARRYRHLFEALGEAAFVADAGTGVVLETNAAGERLLGRQRDEIVGMRYEQLRLPCLPEAEFDASPEQAADAAVQYDSEVHRSDGTSVPVTISASTLTVQEQRLVLALFRDVTEKRRAEEELRRASRLESLALLAGGLAHDFNNILTGVLGSISLAKLHLEQGSKAHELASEAEKASLRARDLTQQLLTFARGGAPVKAAASLRELIRDSAEFALAGSSARCEFALPEELWPADVDRGQVSQVINNLILNADQAMPQGGTIQLRAENVTMGRGDVPGLASGDYVRMAVVDHGVGIAPEHLDRVFDPYFTTKQKGSGLGLATAHSIMRRHGGHITVESQLGVGTTFHLYLPASSKPIVAKQHMQDEALRGHGRVLVMDDEEMVRHTAGRMLSYLGYEVEFAGDGAEAMQVYATAKAAGEPFAAVIMDLTIPGGVGGKEAVKALLESDPEAKAIASSGYSNDPIMSDFRLYGFSGVLVKPYKIDELGEALHHITAPL